MYCIALVLEGFLFVLRMRTRTGSSYSEFNIFDAS